MVKNAYKFVLTAVLAFSITHAKSQSSVLNQGSWFKFSTEQDGIYKLTFEDLENYGVVSSTIPSHQLAVFSNGPGMLPEENWIDRIIDLQQISISVIDGNDNQFGPGDYLLFYGSDQIIWNYDQNNHVFTHQLNFYENRTYFFLTPDWNNGLRVSLNSLNLSEPDNYINTFIDYQLHEVEEVNFIHSGKQWFGENFQDQTTNTINFNFPEVVTNLPAKCTINLVSRSTGTGNMNSFNCSAGNESTSFTVTNVSSNYLNDYVRAHEESFDFYPLSNQIAVNIEMIPFNEYAKGWINFITIQATRSLSMNSSQLHFRDTTALGITNVNGYMLEGVNALHQVWDISNPAAPIKMNGTLLQDVYQFRATSNSLKEFVCFQPTSTLTPTFEEAVTNQNLKAQPFAEGFIITHPDFINQANQLAAFHEQTSGFTVNVATTPQIYNEFSGGAADITAIKDYLRYFYTYATDDSEKPKYLTILGDASYDYKGYEYPGSSIVPTFQSQNSFALITSYCTDDYYGLLDNNESNALGQLIDIGIGRLPANSVAEAQAIVNKIIAYKTEGALGPWQNSALFIADDEDNNLHMNQSNALANAMEINFCPLYVKKIFFDAFEQVNTEDGPRYPEVNQLIAQNIDSGFLLCNYTGHSGHSNWSSEQVLDSAIISQFDNGPIFPMFFMANCEFSKYDNPDQISGSELMLLNENGGAIACVSNARVGYSSSNYIFNNHFNNGIFTIENDVYPALGDLIKNAKNASVSSNIMNHRSVNLIGDAMLRLNYPKNQVVVTDFNNESIDISELAVPFASNLTIEGEIQSLDNNLVTGFNGEIDYLLLDKRVTVITLSNDNTAPFDFQNWQDTICAGTSTVINGQFYIDALAYNNGNNFSGTGKLILFAKSGLETASGCLEGFQIIQSPIGIEETPEIEVSYFPNPVLESLKIQLGESATNISVNVYDDKGSIVNSLNAVQTDYILIPFESFASGTYMLKVVSDKGRNVARIIKP